MSGWYIDAIDPRAGIAFASQRDPDLESDEPQLDRPSAQLSPPGFEPEALGSRALAFATPGHFQLGLFVDEKEMGFETLDQLSEFVRRAYLASGGGDGANGIGPSPSPPPPDEGPPGFDPPPWFEGGSEGCTGTIARLLDKFARASDDLQDNIGGATSLALARSISVRPDRSDMDALAHAGALLIDGLLDVLPVAEGEAAPWLDAVARVKAALAMLDLVPLIRGLHWGRFTGRLAMKLDAARWMDEWRGWAPDSWLMDQLFDGGPELLFAARYGRLVPDWRWPDPLDDLESWPLPRRLRSADIASLRDLLCAASGAPLGLIGRNPLENAALLLFAGVHVATQAGSRPGLWEAMPFAEVVRNRAIAIGAEWIAEQLPAYAFARRVEQAIGEAAAIRSCEDQVAPLEA